MTILDSKTLIVKHSAHSFIAKISRSRTQGLLVSLRNALKGGISFNILALQFVGGNGTVTSILRIIRALLRVELMSDCSIGRALHILGSGVIPTVESDQYGGLVVVCDTLLGLAEALVDVGLVLDQILPILETTELALEAAEEGLFLIRCENHISRLKETAISLSCLCGRVLGHETSGYCLMYISYNSRFDLVISLFVSSFPLGSKQAGFILGVHLRRALEPTHRVRYHRIIIIIMQCGIDIISIAG